MYYFRIVSPTISVGMSPSSDPVSSLRSTALKHGLSGLSLRDSAGLERAAAMSSSSGSSVLSEMNSEEEEEEEDDETVSAGAVSSVAGKRGGRKRGEDYEGVSRSGGEWSEGSSGTVDLSLPDSFDDTLDFVAIAAGGGRGRVGGGGSGSVATGVAAGITAGITTGTVGVVTSLSTKTELVSHVHHLESLLKKNEMLHREELGECKERARREREERAREAREHEKEIRLMEQRLQVRGWGLNAQEHTCTTYNHATYNHATYNHATYNRSTHTTNNHSTQLNSTQLNSTQLNTTHCTTLYKKYTTPPSFIHTGQKRPLFGPDNLPFPLRRTVPPPQFSAYLEGVCVPPGAQLPKPPPKRPGQNPRPARLHLRPPPEDPGRFRRLPPRRDAAPEGRRGARGVAQARPRRERQEAEGGRGEGEVPGEGGGRAQGEGEGL